MQTRPHGANFASSGASNSAIRLISRGIPPHYTSLGCQTFFFFLKVNGPISHQLFLRGLSRQRVNGLKAAATVLHLEAVCNRRWLGPGVHFWRAGGRGEEQGQMRACACLQGWIGEQSNCTVFLPRPRRSGPLCPGDARWLDTVRCSGDTSKDTSSGFGRAQHVCSCLRWQDGKLESILLGASPTWNPATPPPPAMLSAIHEAERPSRHSS